MTVTARSASTRRCAATCSSTASTSCSTPAPAAGRGWSTPATARRHLDLFSFFASAPLGMNHPALADDPAFLAELTEVAVNKPSNSDIYTTQHGRVRRDVRAGARRPRAAAPVPGRGRGAGRRERAEDRVRLEAPAQRGARPAGRARHEGAAPAQGVPRPQRLHAVADQHRPAQDRAVPDVRLAAHRRAGDPLPDGRRRRRGRRGRARWRRPGPRSPRTRTTSPASSPSRSRARAATTTCAPSSCRRCRRCAASTTRCSCSTRCRPAAA